MKQILIVLATFLLASCAAVLDPYSYVCDEMNYALADNIYLSSGDWSSINSLEEITPWIKKRMVYRHDTLNEWDTPSVALARGYGDCEEFCFVFMNIAYVRLGMKCGLAGVDSDERTVRDGGWYNHFVVILPDGTLYEPQGGVPVQFTVKYSYTFDEIF